MCINNAANYVAATSGKLEPIEWAETTHKYAKALYLLGDLNQEPSGYELAKATATQIKSKTEDVVVDMDADEEINLDDIPF